MHTYSFHFKYLLIQTLILNSPLLIIKNRTIVTQFLIVILLHLKDSTF